MCAQQGLKWCTSRIGSGRSHASSLTLTRKNFTICKSRWACWFTCIHQTRGANQYVAFRTSLNSSRFQLLTEMKITEISNPSSSISVWENYAMINIRRPRKKSFRSPATQQTWVWYCICISAWKLVPISPSQSLASDKTLPKVSFNPQQTDGESRARSKCHQASFWKRFAYSVHRANIPQKPPYKASLSVCQPSLSTSFLYLFRPISPSPLAIWPCQVVKKSSNISIIKTISACFHLRLK